MNTNAEWDEITGRITLRLASILARRRGNPDGREKIHCRDYMHLIDELTRPFEFSRDVRKWRVRNGLSPSFTFKLADFKHAQMMCKYKDEL